MCKSKKGYEIIEHLSDIGIKAWAENIYELLEISSTGMFSIICNIESVKQVVKKCVRIEEKNYLSSNIKLREILNSFDKNTVEKVLKSPLKNLMDNSLQCLEEKKLLKVLDDVLENTLEDIIILWLEKLLYLHEVYKLLFSYFKVLKIDLKNNNLYVFGYAFGEKINLEKHEVFVSIKAPTYHMLEVKKDLDSKLWYAKVIFDV